MIKRTSASFRAVDENRRILDLFYNLYEGNGYKKEKEALITSGIDKSVFFIGSAISVLKPYLLSECIPSCGICLAQRSIRTQQLANLTNPERNVSGWSSYFILLGTLNTYQNLERELYNTYVFLRRAGNDNSDLLIRASSQDADLLRLCKNLSNIQLEIDTKDSGYYRHKYGLDSEGIYGRNVNFAVRNRGNNNFMDVGNVIVIEKHGRPIGVEVGLGAGNILAKIHGYSYCVQANPIADFLPCGNIEECVFADCVETAAQLLYEKVRPRSYDRMGGYLNKYLNGALLYANKFGITKKDIRETMIEYLETLFGSGAGDFAKNNYKI